MSVRLLMLAFAFNTAFCASVFAQFQVPESQLTYVETELEKARGTLAEKVAAINYEDPGEKRGWQVSQAAWEKMESKIGYPTPTIEKIIAKDPAQRDDGEKASLRNFYLGFVNEKTKPELQSLVERVELLQIHKRGGKNGITDPVQLAISQRFWKRRLVDPYRAKQQDKSKTQKLVIQYLSRVSDDFAERGRLGNITDRFGRECLKVGCKDPVFRAMVLHEISPDGRKRNSENREAHSKIIEQLESRKSSPMIMMLARAAQCELFRIKNIVSKKELDPARADELENAYNDSVLAMLVEESKCPENIESLEHPFYWMIVSDFRGNRHREALYELISKSDLNERFKQAALQKISGNIARSRRLERELRKDNLAKAVTHGEEAAKLLPLSGSIVEQLALNTRSYEDPKVCMKWYEISQQRAPARYKLYRSYFDAVATLGDDKERDDFMLKLLNSDNFAIGIPWIGIRLIKENVGVTWDETGQKCVRDNQKVLLTVEALLKKAPEQGQSPEWCKSKRQLLCHEMLLAGYFDDAVRVGKDLDGDFGNYPYKGQKVTLTRIAGLANPTVRETQESIEAGTFDITKIEELIDELSLARMEFGPNESTYIDELLELLESVEAFESGKWANLTPKTVHLSNWRGYQASEWRPTENGISRRTSSSSVQNQLGWRWKVDSEYMLEADIEIAPVGKVSKKWSASAGFVISTGKHINAPSTEILINPRKSIAVMNAFRVKTFEAKTMLNQEGINRVRMRVWKDYFEFTINGKLAGQYVMPSAIPGHAILKKGRGAANVTFKNVRVKKLTSPSPTYERLDDVSYWSERLEGEPASKDVQLALKKAEEKADEEAEAEAAEEEADEDAKAEVKAEQEDGGDQQEPDVQASSERTPIKVGEGLVALWTFDQNSNESFSKGESQSALPTKLVDGKLGSGLLISGKNTSNQIVADGEGPTNLDGPFTVSFWARCENDNGVLISQSGESAYLMVKLYDGNLRIEHHRPGLHMSCRTRRDLPLKKWHHITITYDGSPDAEGIEVFLNGKKHKECIKRGFLAEDARELLPIDSSKTQMHFGCSTNDHQHPPRFGECATIDELRVYNRKLSTDEIMQVKSYGVK